MKNIKQYYKELGRVVYAIASADGEIKPDEKYFTRQYIERFLVPNEYSYDSSGMNNAYYADFEFDKAWQSNSDTGIENFLSYIDHNYEKGDEDLIKRSFTLINRVAFDFDNEYKREPLSSNKVNKVLDMYYLNRNKNFQS